MDEIAREDASVLGLFGTGRQARAHCEAICAVRPIRRVRVYSPNPAHLGAFVRSMKLPDVDIAAMPNARSVVDGADIVCSTTNSTEPVVRGEWLREGQTVMSIGNSDPTVTRREVDADVFARASDIVIHDWDSVHANNQIELLERIEGGDVDPERIHLLGDIVAGRATVKIHARQHRLLQEQHRPRDAVRRRRRDPLPQAQRRIQPRRSPRMAGERAIRHRVMPSPTVTGAVQVRPMHPNLSFRPQRRRREAEKSVSPMPWKSCVADISASPRCARLRSI